MANTGSKTHLVAATDRGSRRCSALQALSREQREQQPRRLPKLAAAGRCEWTPVDGAAEHATTAGLVTLEAVAFARETRAEWLCLELRSGECFLVLFAGKLVCSNGRVHWVAQSTRVCSLVLFQTARTPECLKAAQVSV